MLLRFEDPGIPEPGGRVLVGWPVIYHGEIRAAIRDQHRYLRDFKGPTSNP